MKRKNRECAGGRSGSWGCMLGAAVLFLYPLRHVHLGVDLMDAGYNCANFRFFGLEYMDPMWFFATYLANLTGKALRLLPGGGTLYGMNLYTGLFISLITAGSYLFLIRKEKLPAWIVFAGEFAAASLCWAPSTVLYNYLTYGLLLGGILLLSLALTENRTPLFVLAGVLLGINVGVRFSNLVDMGLILGVWCYGLFAHRKLSETASRTGLCAAGYLVGLALFLVPVCLLYGPEQYAAGIRRLFEMTDVATDYSAGSMFAGILGDYFSPAVTYLLKRFLLIPALGCALCLFFPSRLHKAKRFLTVCITLAVMCLLPRLGFYTKDYASYYSMRYPCTVALLAATLLALLETLRKKSSDRERLFALFVLLSLLLTPLGGNNAMFSNINNMFLAAPYLLWTVYRLCKGQKSIFLFPVKCLLCAILFFFLLQSVLFGRHFVYEEADGGRSMTAEITDIPALKGILTNEQKAERLNGLYRYVQEHGLADRAYILYGNIPGVSYYLDLTPAMNVWPDLRSYRCEVMEADLEAVGREIPSSGKPVIVIEARYADWMADDGGMNPPESSGAGPEDGPAGSEDGQSAREEERPAFSPEPSEVPKLKLLGDFIAAHGYTVTYSDEKFVLYE